MKKLLLTTLLLTAPFGISSASAADYVIDVEGMHAAINFKVRHVGISWLTGRFDRFSGTFSYDEDNLMASKVSVDIEVGSVNSNHEARDKHIQDPNYLNVEAHPMAHFESTSIEKTSDTTATINGNLTLNGVTKPFALMTTHVGQGDDPWGGYRAAFEATAMLDPQEFDFKFEYGDVELNLYVEGVRQ